MTENSGTKNRITVVPFASYRFADESGWEVVLGPALQDVPSGDDLADVQTLTDCSPHVSDVPGARTGTGTAPHRVHCA